MPRGSVSLCLLAERVISKHRGPSEPYRSVGELERSFTKLPVEGTLGCAKMSHTEGLLAEGCRLSEDR